MNQDNDRVLAVRSKFKEYDRLLRGAKTPFFLLEEEGQEKHLQMLELCSKGKFEIFQVYKSNPIKRICEMGALHGFGAEVVNEKELRLALKFRQKIIFNGLDKTEEELKLAIKNKDRVIIIIDNVEEVERIAKLAKGEKIRVGIRISIRGAWSRFGLTESEIGTVLNSSELEVIGFHVHSGIERDIEYYKKILNIMRQIIINNREKLKKLEFVDIGGAFPTKGYKPYSLTENIVAKCSKYCSKLDWFLMPKEKEFDYVDMTGFLNKVYDEYKKIIISLEFIQPKLYIEPGRLITSPNIYFIAKVLNIKRDEIILDGGYNNLPPIAREKHIVLNLSSSTDAAKFNKANIYGPLPHVADFLSRYYYGDKLKKGDVVMICDVGSYYYAMASNFIKDKAPFYSLSKKKLRRID